MREFLSPQEILKLFERDPQRTFRLRELVLELGLRSSQARELKSVLKDLARGRKLVYLRKNHYALVHKGRHAASEAVAAVSDRRGGGQRPPLQHLTRRGGPCGPRHSGFSSGRQVSCCGRDLSEGLSARAPGWSANPVRAPARADGKFAPGRARRV